MLGPKEIRLSFGEVFEEVIIYIDRDVELTLVTLIREKDT